MEYKSFSKKKLLCILRVIFHWQFRFSRNGIFPTDPGHLVFFAKSLNTSSFYKSEAKTETEKSELVI